MSGEDRDRTDIVEWRFCFLVNLVYVSRPQLKLVERRHGLRDRFIAVPVLIVPAWMNGRAQQHQLAQVRTCRHPGERSGFEAVTCPQVLVSTTGIDLQ